MTVATQLRPEGTRVQLRSIRKSFAGNTVLHGLDLDIAPGEFVSLLGPSGCGKTTALRVLAGLEAADSGVVLFGGRDVSDVPVNRRDIGMVFQSYSLFPHLRVLDNVAFGLRRRKVTSALARLRARESLDLVGLADFADRFPHQLSGGQQQRVALARALVTEPRVLLLDEPLSALDAKVRVSLRDEIRQIQLRLGITTVFVTHDQEEALAVSDRVAVMGAGLIEQIGTPEDLYLRPATALVAEFVGLSSTVDAQAAGAHATVFGQDVPLREPIGDGPVEVYLRPENLRLVGPSEPGVDAEVAESSFLGSFRRTLVRTHDGTLVRVQHPATDTVSVGQRLRIGLVPVPVLARPTSPDASSTSRLRRAQPAG
jgi:putative spermidine/putrescine transport system ATP-binding protein